MLKTPALCPLGGGLLGFSKLETRENMRNPHNFSAKKQRDMRENFISRHQHSKAIRQGFTCHEDRKNHFKALDAAKKLAQTARIQDEGGTV